MITSVKTRISGSFIKLIIFELLFLPVLFLMVIESSGQYPVMIPLIIILSILLYILLFDLFHLIFRIDVMTISNSEVTYRGYFSKRVIPLSSIVNKNKTDFYINLWHVKTLDITYLNENNTTRKCSVRNNLVLSLNEIDSVLDEVLFQVNFDKEYGNNAYKLKQDAKMNDSSFVLNIMLTVFLIMFGSIFIGFISSRNGFTTGEKITILIYLTSVVTLLLSGILSYNKKIPVHFGLIVDIAATSISLITFIMMFVIAN